MPTLRTHKELGAAYSITFCYLCSETFGRDEERTRDHVVPRAVFAKGDLNPPLLLPVHERCNLANSPDDEVVGQLVSLIHGRAPSRERQRLKAVSIEPAHGGGPTFHAVEDLPLHRIIWRWVRGFHAALYREPLPSNATGGLMVPFPSAVMVQGGLRFDRIRFDQEEWVVTLKQHIRLGRIDEVVSCNGKCRYVCTWLMSDQNEPFCLYGLRLYHWETMASDYGPSRRGCVGFYTHPQPENASLGTGIIVPTHAFHLDPFS